MTTEADDIRALWEEVYRTRGAGGIPAGTTFPTSPPDGFVFYRTDLGFLCYYDLAHTQWLTVNEWEAPITYSTDLTATYSATTSAVRRGGLRSSHKAYVTRLTVVTLLGAGTSDGSNFWTVALVAIGAPTTVWSFTTAADTASQTTIHTTATPTNQPTQAETLIRMDVTKTATPPTITPVAASLFYRLVIT